MRSMLCTDLHRQPCTATDHSSAPSAPGRRAQADLEPPERFDTVGRANVEERDRRKLLGAALYSWVCLPSCAPPWL